LNQPKSGAVLFAKDLSRVAKFYEELLDLSVAVARIPGTLKALFSHSAL